MQLGLTEITAGYFLVVKAVKIFSERLTNLFTIRILAKGSRKVF